jgi:hypothetical protein
MNVLPINRSAAEKHVQFSEYVDVRRDVPMPAETTTVEPSMHAQRLERAMRTANTVDRRASTATPSRPVKTYKSACEKASMLCGALAIPSFITAVFLGPIGLVVPAALIVCSIIFAMLRGKPTQEILDERERRTAEVRMYDSQI